MKKVLLILAILTLLIIKNVNVTTTGVLITFVDNTGYYIGK